MGSRKKRYNPLKGASDYLVEEAQTPAEKLMDEILPPAPVVTDDDLKDTSQIIQHIEQTQDTENAQSAEQELLDLLDKYYNGDRDTPKELRYKNKEQYKQLLITKFKQWGLLYIEKKHYALSRPEKHLIRIDFYGTVNKPRPDQKSDVYQQNSLTFKETLSRKEKKRAKNLTLEEAVPTSTEKPQYSPQDYDLNLSPTWRLMRTFPRFHTIENKVRIQMAKQGVNPTILPFLNVYDYSDILYNYYQRPETQEGENVRIFLGARQTFIKDLFKKHTAWLRDYFQRHNYDERYIEALIKSAQKKGVTTNIELKDTVQEYIFEYLRNHKQKFLNFTKEQAYKGNHIHRISEILENPNTPLTDEMRNFIKENEEKFTQALKRKYITGHLLNATFEIFTEQEIPFYLTENIRGFILQDTENFQKYLKEQNFTDSEYEIIKEKLKNRPPRGKIEAILIEYTQKNLNNFQEYLLLENRDENYIKYAKNRLQPPLIPEYLRESVLNFILSRQDSPSLVNRLQQKGITSENYPLVKDYVLKHRKEYSDFFKQNNILTYQELNEQYTDITNFIIKTRNIPPYIKNFAQQFIRRNQTVFRYWYSNFRLQQHQKTAEKKHKNILEHGLNENDFEEVSTFIKERLDMFSNFCQDKGFDITPNTIQTLFNQGNFLNSQELSKFQNQDKIIPIKNLLEQFIKRNGYIYRNSLIQQHIKAKENEADILLKKIAQQGINTSTMAIAHKFILNNKPLFNNDLYNSSEAADYSQEMMGNLFSNSNNKDIQRLSKKFITNHQKQFLTFINSPQNIEHYRLSIAKQLETDQNKGDITYWGLQYIAQHQNSFLQYLESEKIGPQNIENFKKQLEEYSLSQNIKMIFEKENLTLLFNDGYRMAINIAVHHINAVQDSFEKCFPISNDKQSTAQNPDYVPNLAAANYFENLFAIINDPYHVRFFHGMDKTEKFDNRERYIGRIYPQRQHIVFFGGLDPKDQLTYDYSNDERTKRYRQHTEKMMHLNEQQKAKDTLSPEMSFYIVTGSRQGRN